MTTPFDDSFDYLTMIGVSVGAMGHLDAIGLREIIKRKKKEWTSQAINPLYQQAARARLERARQFEQILDDPAALEAYVDYLRQVQAAHREQQTQEMGRLAAQVAAAPNRRLTAAQRDLLRKEAEDRGFPGDVVDEVVRNLKLTIDEIAAPPAPQIPYKQPAMDRALLMQVNNYLRVLRKKSFYELLDLPARTPPARIMAMAQTLYARWSKSLPKTTECAAWEKSLQACMTFLKDDEGQERYNCGLYNQRLDEFLRRVDLVLAGGEFSRENQAQLAETGVREFGLTDAVVNQCLSVRAASKGLATSRPVIFKVAVNDRVQCLRCFAYNAAREPRCKNCGGHLAAKCLNPACRHPISAGSKTCGECGLAAFRGPQYAELIRLIELLLNDGSFRPAVEALQVARQILPAPELERQFERAGKIRALSASVRRAASDKQWSRVHADLLQLVQLAPNLSAADMPKLEDVTRWLSQMRQRMNQAAAAETPAAEARELLACLNQWTDCAEAAQRLESLGDALETARDFATAHEIALRLAQFRPLSEVDSLRLERIRLKSAAATERQAEETAARGDWRRALAEHRLYAAERAWQSLVELGLDDDALRDEYAALQRQLVALRGEVQELRRQAADGVPQSPIIDRYLSLLQRCRDCREALAALKDAQPDPLAAPLAVRVALAGNRREISWEPPPDGRSPSSYTVERLLTRPGVRPNPPAWVVIHEGRGRHCVDDEIVHTGGQVQYAVRAVLAGRLEVEGSVLREYTVKSEPAYSEPLLLWQEVLGLKAQRLRGGISLRWHQPAGVRQVLVERWAGGRQDRPDHPLLLPVEADGRLQDLAVQAGTIYSYRLVCVYDGPGGDFVTPGVIVTESPLETAGNGTPPAVSADQNTGIETVGGLPIPAEAGSERPLDDQALRDVLKDASPEGGPPAVELNPLKRLGIWPPLRN